MTALVPCAFCATLNRIDLERHAHGPKCGRCQRPILLDRPVRLNEAGVFRCLAKVTTAVMEGCRPSDTRPGGHETPRRPGDGWGGPDYVPDL